MKENISVALWAVATLLLLYYAKALIAITIMPA
jgi:hypothetical protein